MKVFAIGAAAIALVASGAVAQDNGNGNGKGKDAGNDRGSPPAMVERGGRPEKSQGQGTGERGTRDVDERRDERTRDRIEEERTEPAADRREERRQVKREVRDEARDSVDTRRDIRRDVRREVRERNDKRVDVRKRYDRDPMFFRRDAVRSYVDGCPPGLAEKNNGCLPPGQAKKKTFWGSAYQPARFGLRNYGRGDYSYNDGYLLRLGDAGRIAGYIPLLGGALSIGNPWPDQYESYSVPDYYIDYFSLGRPDRYRFADNVIYRVDPETSAIQSVAALLTGNEFVVGQPMPRGYDVYNVPYAYRDQYFDTPEAMYRYSDGYVYRVDPETQLVAAAIDLLVQSGGTPI